MMRNCKALPVNQSLPCKLGRPDALRGVICMVLMARSFVWLATVPSKLDGC